MHLCVYVYTYIQVHKCVGSQKIFINMVYTYTLPFSDPVLRYHSSPNGTLSLKAHIPLTFLLRSILKNDKSRNKHVRQI